MEEYLLTARSVTHAQRMMQALAQNGYHAAMGRSVSRGDGFSVPQSGGGAVRRGRSGKGGIHRQRHPRAEHRHQNAGKAGEPGHHLRV